MEHLAKSIRSIVETQTMFFISEINNNTEGHHILLLNIYIHVKS